MVINKICLICGQEIKGKRITSKRKYCLDCSQRIIDRKVWHKNRLLDLDTDADDKAEEEQMLKHFESMGK